MKRPKGKKLVMAPVYRCRQEKPAKGKGSYRRKPRTKQLDGAFSCLAAGVALFRIEKTRCFGGHRVCCL